jgi:hypothetical protein
MEVERFGQGGVEGVSCTRNSCHCACSAWASKSRVCDTPGRRCPCSNCDAVANGAEGATWDVDVSALCAGRCDITQPLDRTTSVDGPYNKDPTVKTSGSRGVYNKFHAHFLY